MTPALGSERMSWFAVHISDLRVTVYNCIQLRNFGSMLSCYIQHLYLVVVVVVLKGIQLSWRAFIPCLQFRKLPTFLQFWQSHASCQVQMLFSSNFVSTIFQSNSIIRFLSPVDELKSIKCFTLLASRDVRKTNSFLVFSVLVFGNLNSSFDRDDKFVIFSSLMLFCGSFESCKSSNKFSDCI